MHFLGHLFCQWILSGLLSGWILEARSQWIILWRFAVVLGISEQLFPSFFSYFDDCIENIANFWIELSKLNWFFDPKKTIFSSAEIKYLYMDSKLPTKTTLKVSENHSTTHVGIQRKLWKWSEILVGIGFGYKNNKK